MPIGKNAGKRMNPKRVDYNIISLLLMPDVFHQGSVSGKKRRTKKHKKPKIARMCGINLLF
jgi:hypothetical protein